MSEQTTGKWSIGDVLKLARGGPAAADIGVVDGQIVEMPDKVQRLHDMIQAAQREVLAADDDKQRMLAEHQRRRDEIDGRLRELRAKWVEISADLGVAVVSGCDDRGEP